MTDIEPPITEPIAAPEIFIDGLQSWSVTNGVVKFTLFSMAHNPTQPNNVSERRIVLRLSTTAPAAAGMGHVINQILEKLEEMRQPEVIKATQEASARRVN